MVSLGLGRKGGRKGLVRVFVFLPALRTGWGTCGKYGDDEGDEAHFSVFPGEMGRLQPPTSYAVARTIGSRGRGGGWNAAHENGKVNRFGRRPETLFVIADEIIE